MRGLAWSAAVLLGTGCPALESAPDCTPTIPVWSDDDGDGFGGTELPLTCVVGPDMAAQGQDCDDTNPLVFPGGDELCDGIDNDCNGEIDQDLPGLEAWFVDDDGDGFGSRYPGITACGDPGDGWVENSDDCDDSDADIRPGAVELCNGGIDDDCDGLEDDTDPSLDVDSLPVWYRDTDGDGFGNPLQTLQACHSPAGYVDNGLDCGDLDFERNPNAVEVCNDLDDDCNGFIDDQDPNVDPTTQSDFYVDADQDGWGTASMPVRRCRGGPGLAPNELDCNDMAPRLNQDDFDSDGWTSCDGDCDDTDPTISPDDIDNDGFSACDPVPDCAPADPTVFPGAYEHPADQVDQDCDGVDDCYRDGDLDGYGSTQVVIGNTLSCLGPGEANNDEDCDDTSPLITIPRPWYVDDDGDGHGTGNQASFACVPPFPDLAPTATDCDDDDPTVNPDAEEICTDEIDQDCNGSLTCCDITREVEFDGACYYLDGSGGVCLPDYELAPQSILVDIAAEFVGLTYMTHQSDNCCIEHADQAVDLQDWGMSGGDCNAIGTFGTGPSQGGSGCTNVLNLNPNQLTLCQSQ